MTAFPAFGLAACIAAALTATSAPAAPAHSDTHCHAAAVCTLTPQEQPHRQAKAPRVGDSARGAPQLRADRAGGLVPPPRGREYRVLRDRVVLVDSATLAVLRVLDTAPSAAR